MSDRRRYFKVADSIAHEQWSDHELATMVRLMAHLHERWARDGLTPEQAGHCELGPTQVIHISRRRRADVARKSLEHLTNLASISVRSHGDVLVIDWPKFAEFQGLPSRERAGDTPDTPPKVCPPKTDPKTDPKTEIRKEDYSVVGNDSSSAVMTPTMEEAARVIAASPWLRDAFPDPRQAIHQLCAGHPGVDPLAAINRVILKLEDGAKPKTTLRAYVQTFFEIALTGGSYGKSNGIDTRPAGGAGGQAGAPGDQDPYAGTEAHQAQRDAERRKKAS